MSNVLPIRSGSVAQVNIARLKALTRNLLVRLTGEQAAALEAAIGRFTTRPTCDEYDAVRRELAAIPVPPAPKLPAKCIRGYEPADIKLRPGFCPPQHLPLGHGLYSCLDSGGNHRLANAAQIVWTSLWNGWIG